MISLLVWCVDMMPKGSCILCRKRHKSFSREFDLPEEADELATRYSKRTEQKARQHYLRKNYLHSEKTRHLMGNTPKE